MVSDALTCHSPPDLWRAKENLLSEQGAIVVIGDTPVAMTAVDRKSTLGRYLQQLISQNRFLQLQGIRSGGKLVIIELSLCRRNAGAPR